MAMVKNVQQSSGGKGYGEWSKEGLHRLKEEEMLKVHTYIHREEDEQSESAEHTFSRSFKAQSRPVPNRASNSRGRRFSAEVQEKPVENKRNEKLSRKISMKFLQEFFPEDNPNVTHVQYLESIANEDFEEENVSEKPVATLIIKLN
jgi:hypothetical protein